MTRQKKCLLGKNEMNIVSLIEYVTGRNFSSCIHSKMVQANCLDQKLYGYEFHAHCKKKLYLIEMSPLKSKTLNCFRNMVCLSKN